MLITNPYSIRLGVLGGGTMGSGIALTALQANMIVSLYDVSEEMLAQARAYIETHLARKGKQLNLRNLNLTTKLEELGGAGVVIEAIPEDLALKQSLFARLDEICPPPAILATNTSTLAVTAIASAVKSPERVAGMHFFNPAPVLPLVEIVRGAATAGDTIKTLLSLAEMLGKTAVVASDSPGFIVNRVARPFYGEALRLLGERVASQAEIDRLVEAGAGFRMGPFRLMDLIGIDINLAAMQSMYEQTYGEPRYKPHPIQVQMVQQKRLGQKTGRGFYTYPNQDAPLPPAPVRASRRAGSVLFTPGTWFPGLANLSRKVGYHLLGDLSSEDSLIGLETFSLPDERSKRPSLPEVGKPVIAALRAGRTEGAETILKAMERDLPAEIPILCQCSDLTLAEMATWVQHPERLVGIDGLFFQQGTVACLTALSITSSEAKFAAQAFCSGLGRQIVWIKDTPAAVLPRILSMLANEAAFAVQHGVADPTTIDQAMRLGMNYPRGPLEWAAQIGYAKIVAILDHLFHEFHEERYRASTLLRQLARLEQIRK
jgi:3-hydroxybutyryl-CoA dehydrogenase